MENRVILLEVEDCFLKKTGEILGASGSAHALTLRLHFGRTWEGTAKTLYFLDANGANPVAVSLGLLQLVVGSESTWEATVPGEALAVAGNATLTIQGVSCTGTVVTRAITTQAARFKVLAAEIPTKAGNAATITASEKAQLQEQIAGLEALFVTKAQVASEAAVAAAAAALAAGASEEAAAEQARLAAEAAASAREKAQVATGAAKNATQEADRAKGEADRAVAVVGGDFATRAEARGYVTTHNASAAAHPNKLTCLKNARILHVSKSGSNTSGDGSEAKPYLTIQHAINTLPKYLEGRATIVLHQGEYDEAVICAGFTGGNSLEVTVASGESVGVRSFYLSDNPARLVLSSFRLSGTNAAAGNASLFAENCAYVLLRDIHCTQPVAQDQYGAIFACYGTTLFVQSGVISNKAIAVDAMAATIYLNENTTGTGNTVAIRCGSPWGSLGGWVQRGGMRIAGIEQTAYGGQIF